jgi:hypothetical protein
MKYLVLLAAVVVLLGSGPLPAATRVAAGEVTGTWTESGSPYVVEGNLTVPGNQTLRIEKKVRLEFAGPYRIVVRGQLIADASDTRHVRLTPETNLTIRFTTDPVTNPAGWCGLRFINADTGSKLVNCVLEYGRATGDGSDGTGGAVYVEGSTLDVANCVFEHNSARLGGALACVRGEVNVANCAFKGNTGLEGAGAVYAEGGQLDLANVEIEDNAGGGLYCRNSGVDIANCAVRGNRSGREGGGIRADSASLDIANASVSGNTNGGIALLSSSATLVNCAVERNEGAERGGGLLCLNSHVSLANVSVGENSSGGLFCGTGSSVSLTNCSLLRNRGGRNLTCEDGTSISKSDCSIGD